MTIFALEQAVSNGCQLDITEAESALEEVAALRADLDRAIVNFGDAAATLCELRAQIAEAKADNKRLYEASLDCIDHCEALKTQLAEAKSRIKELETPTMFWDFNNPEHAAFDSPYYAICDGDFDEGAEVSFMTARALPTVTVRVTRDSEGNYDYEYIDAAKGESDA